MIFHVSPKLIVVTVVKINSFNKRNFHFNLLYLLLHDENASENFVFYNKILQDKFRENIRTCFFMFPQNIAITVGAILHGKYFQCDTIILTKYWLYFGNVGMKCLYCRNIGLALP